MRTDRLAPSRPRLSVDPAAQGEVALLSLSGELTGIEAVVLRDAVDEAVDQGPATLRLGLADVTFMDSGGAQALVRVRDRAATAGIALQLLGPSLAVARVLGAAGLAGVFDVIE